MAKTFADARSDLLAFLRGKGWTVKGESGFDRLKVPHATSPDRQFRLWFKPQAVHFTEGEHSGGNARTISYDLDIRRMSPEEFLSLLKRKFPGPNLGGIMARRRRKKGLGRLGEVTKKDFVEIARILKFNSASCSLVQDFSSYFGSQNPRFDSARFIAATGRCKGK